jgi:hypothetical protein
MITRGAGRFGTRASRVPTREYRRGGSPAGLYTFRRTARLSSRTPPAARLGITRSTPCPGRVWASPNSPGSPRRVATPGPSSDEGNRCSIHLCYERFGESVR